MDSQLIKCLRHWLVPLFILTLLFIAVGRASYVSSANLFEQEAPLRAYQPQLAPTPTSPLISAMAVEPAIVNDGSPVQARVSKPSPPSEERYLPQASSTQLYNLIVNGSFEDGFVEGIAVGWQHFATGGVRASWHNDMWQPVLYDGAHAQLLALKDATERDRYVGIFQTVPVVPNMEYVLTLHGLVRSDEGSVDASDYGYRLQYGIDYTGANDWRSPQIDWIELPWDEQPRTAPPPGGYRIGTYTTTIRAQEPTLTLFIRGWKKWVGMAEGNYNVDGISLVVAQAEAAPAQQLPAPEETQPAPMPQMPQTGDTVASRDGLTLASILIVALLVAGAIWQARHRRV